MKSIQTKILIVVIAGLLVITAAVSAIAVNMTHEIMHKDADRILKNASGKEAAGINDVLNDVVKSVEIMEHYTISELDSIDLLENEELRLRYEGKIKNMFNEVALNTENVLAYYLRFDPAFTTPTSGFFTEISKFGELVDIQPTDLSEYSPDDDANVGWYYIPKAAEKGVWLSPYSNGPLGTELISYVVPLYKDETFFGIVGIDLDFNKLVNYINQMASEISVYENGIAALMNEDMTVCYNLSTEVLEESEHGHQHAEAVSELVNGMKFELRADYKDIQRGIRPMLMRIVIAFIMVLGGAIIYTVVVTHRIVTPLKKLTVAAKELSLTDMSQDVDLPVDSKDEIGTLARVLSETYSRIREYSVYINALAYRDSLTGIKNSTAYIEAINEINKEINHSNPLFGVIVADINNLKQTNDRYGHDIGNELIVRTANIMSETFKTSSVYRIGGDEFVIILKNRDFDKYRERIAKMDKHFSEAFIEADGDKIPVSLARGVALFDSKIDKVYGDVLEKADQAMYMNKEEMKAAKL